MVTVAVAGGTGGIGRTIVEELVSQQKHKLLILGRKVNLPETPDETVLLITNRIPQLLVLKQSR